MVGRLTSLVLVVSLSAPAVALAQAPKKPAATKAAPRTTAKPPAPTPTPTPAPPPTVVPATALAPSADGPGRTACGGDPATEAACLRRENDDLRRQITRMLAGERDRQARLQKEMGGGKAIDTLR